MYGYTHSRVWINPVRLSILLVVSYTRKMSIFLSAFTPENLVSRDGLGSLVSRQPAHLYTQAESGAYLTNSSRVPRRRPFTYFKPPYAIGSVPSFSGHAIAYRWRSLPKVRRHRASKSQGSSERVLPWQVIMDQLLCASLSTTLQKIVTGLKETHLELRVMILPWFIITLYNVRMHNTRENRLQRNDVVCMYVWSHI